MFARRLAYAALPIAMAAVSASPAGAEVLLSRTRTDASVFGGATYLVDFNGAAAGGTAISFTTDQPNTRVVILFNAECAVEGAHTRWVNVDIRVDPAGAGAEASAPPSNGDNAFCSGNGTTTAGGGDFSLDGWVSAVTVATVNLPVAGTHVVKVRIDGSSSLVARLDDMSLIVMD